MLNKEKPVKVIVDKEKCTKCGYCLRTCENYLTQDAEGYPIARKIEESLLGCIQCGRCMMKCPTEALEIIGEDIDKNHLRAMPEKIADYESLNGLMLKRRSIRRFSPDEVLNDDIDKIINTAATAPIGIPPSEVKVLVFQGRKKVQEFAQDLCNEIKHTKKVMTPLALKLMKPFVGESQYKIMKDFALPLCNMILSERKKGNDMLFYDAPAVMVFLGTELTDAEDMIIAATNATIAAESLNLGACFVGTVSYFLNKSTKLKEKYGILKGEKVATAFVLGYPDEGYFRTFQRNFKEVKIIN